jgi:hypothetical protein
MNASKLKMSNSDVPYDPPVRLTAEQKREVERIQKQIREGTMRFATDEEMDALWKKCGLKD